MAGMTNAPGMTAQGSTPAPFPYRWGRFEGWLLVVWSSLVILGLGVALLIRVRRAGGLEASGIGVAVVPLLAFLVGLCAVIFLTGMGLLGKRNYALRLVYLRLGLSVLLACGVVAGRSVGPLGRRAWWGGARAVWSLAFSIPTARYYYRRRREFH